MVRGHDQQTEFDHLPEWEQEYFHLLNCPPFQVGYYEKALGQLMNH